MIRDFPKDQCVINTPSTARAICPRMPHPCHKIALLCSFGTTQYLISYYRGLCTYFSGQNHRRFHTKYRLYLVDFVVHAVCVCIKLPETCPGKMGENAHIQKGRNAHSFWNRAPCHTPTHQNNQENPCL